MFDQVNGLPAHVLVVHAVVIFVPLLALGAIVFALVAKLRAKIGWVVGLLAVAAPASALVAMLTGNAFFDRLNAEKRVSPAGAQIISDHQGFGQLTFWFSLALGIVTLILVFLTLRKASSLPKAADLGLAVLTVALAAVSAYYVFRTGDSGATAVWGQY